MMRISALDRRSLLPATATVLLTALALALPATADVSRARALAAQGRCAEAVPLIEAAQADGSADASLLLLGGQCQIREKRFVEAVALLEAAQAAQPDLAGVDLYLGIARFHVGDLAGSEQAIAAAAQREPQRAEVLLYQGLLLLQNGQNREAIAALERARAADPEAVEPVASYYLGVAYAAEQDEDSARAALGSVRQRYPGTRWSDQAGAVLDRAPGEGPGRWWVSATAGFEYDNNVVLRGSGVNLPSDISSQRDIRGVLSAEAGLEFLRTEDWTLGGLVRVYGSEHDDLDDFETWYPTLTLWADYRIGRGLTARAQYDGGYGWVDTDPFLESHILTLALFQEWGRPGRSRLFANYYRYDWLFGNVDVPDGPGLPGQRCRDIDDIVCGPVGVRESTARNRDGWGSSFGFDHWLPVGDGNVELRSGYRFHKYSSRGSEYSYVGHQGLLGARIQLPFEFVLDLLGSYTYKPYRNRSTFPDPDELIFNTQYRLANHQRRDNIIQFDVELERRLTDHLSASIRYTYLRNRSDVAVFDYRREVIGAYLTVRFQELGG